MAGSISEFKSSFSTDVARPSRFDVEVPIPLGLVPYLGISRKLKFRCESTELPSRSISTVPMKIYGPVENYPYQTTFQDITLTFIVGDNMEEKLFFDAWLEWINPSLTYNFKFKGDYAVPLRINQYDVQNKVSYSVDLIDAFPVAINSMQLDSSADGYHKLTVSFTFTSWKNNSFEALGMQLLEAGIGSVIDQLGGLGGNSSTAAIGIGVQALTGSEFGFKGMTNTKIAQDITK
jgi:hypothetical protein